MNQFEPSYARCRPERGAFDRYGVDAQTTVDLGDAEDPAIFWQELLALLITIR
jgi:hypothetical protein